VRSPVYYFGFSFCFVLSLAFHVLASAFLVTFVRCRGFYVLVRLRGRCAFLRTRSVPVCVTVLPHAACTDCAASFSFLRTCAWFTPLASHCATPLPPTHPADAGSRLRSFFTFLLCAGFAAVPAFVLYVRASLDSRSHAFCYAFCARFVWILHTSFLHLLPYFTRVCRSLVLRRTFTSFYMHTFTFTTLLRFVSYPSLFRVLVCLYFRLRLRCTLRLVCAVSVQCYRVYRTTPFATFSFRSAFVLRCCSLCVYSFARLPLFSFFGWTFPFRFVPLRLVLRSLSFSFACATFALDCLRVAFCISRFLVASPPARSADCILDFVCGSPDYRFWFTRLVGCASLLVTCVRSLPFVVCRCAFSIVRAPARSAFFSARFLAFAFAFFTPPTTARIYVWIYRAFVTVSHGLPFSRFRCVFTFMVAFRGFLSLTFFTAFSARVYVAVLCSWLFSRFSHVHRLPYVPHRIFIHHSPFVYLIFSLRICFVWVLHRSHTFASPLVLRKIYSLRLPVLLRFRS